MPKSLFVDPAELMKQSIITFDDIPVNMYQRTVAEERKFYSDEELVRIYADMATLREFEKMLLSIKTQGAYSGIEATYPGPAHLSLGQESAAVGQAFLLTRDDIIFGSHRSHGEILAKSLSCVHSMPEPELVGVMEGAFGGRILRAIEKAGCKPADARELATHFVLYGALAEVFARTTGFNMGVGGSMHAFFLPFGVYPNNAIVGASAAIAAGAALFKRCNGKPGLAICNIGDGSLGCGPVWEAMNFSAMDQYRTLWDDGRKGGLPIVFNIFNNGYGMGGQTRGETMAFDMLARIGAGVAPSQMHAERVWGHNPLAVIDAYKRKKLALDRSGGPILLDVVTYRLAGHSTSDQDAYRTKEEVAAWQAADPCAVFRSQLVEAGVAPDAAFDSLWAKTEERMARICRWAADTAISPYADFLKDYRAIERFMFTDGAGGGAAAASPPAPAGKAKPPRPATLIPKEECSRVRQIAAKSRFAFGKDGAPVGKQKTYDMRDAIFEPLIDKFYEDPTLIAYGEDVRDWGGAFGVYSGLAEALPYPRLFNAPISEAAIVGSGVGYGMCGGRAVVELMYCDFIGRAGDEVFNQLSKWQAMSAGALKMPVVLRVPVGAKYGAQHSQEWTSLCAHIPGLKVCFPATPYEAKGLMQSALDGADPVVFFESQRLYEMGEMFHEGGVPAGPYGIRIGDVDVVRRGGDVTILAVGASLYKAAEAADTLAKSYGLSAELISLHSLVPLDYSKICASVAKTGRVALVSDACARGSFLNDVARNVTELCFDDLDAPPVVVGAQNWIAPPFEFDEFYFPQASWILDAIDEKLLALEGHVPTVNSYVPAEQMRRARAGV